MVRGFHWYALVVLAFCFVGLTACSKTPTVQDICEKLAPDDVEDCVGELGEELEECENKDDVLKCMGEADGEDAAEACFRACEVAEGGE